MLKKLSLLMMLILACNTFANDKLPTFNSPKNPIVVSQKNPQFIITLASNPSTGFSWKLLSYDKNLVQFVKHQYIAPHTKLLGAPGYEVWTFKAKKGQYRVNQVGHVVLEYQRPWTKEGATQKSFMIIVKK
ncbi:MAG: hypothetical protein COY58_09570 [Gammaproteobacteria bacterium CG_4_10_14_0_8_um_filter_38_16]|nr:MAG: hypothetical protein COY58_09570 [Gammaproteobacteria bacterium CG_4_10_14_0_8_um_filter_38_16]PJA03065.1 MAG: hypothetical protein COX72_07095 [Gammaproteobacteria bacterium CG_4_10_14_0_2_um_filter_38_22]PJB10116.1 MAG: hypothetical protein CO120_06460 [Gammaproteobacteria bacterium CG_4_9_14_3_um_filter_38_9]